MTTHRMLPLPTQYDTAAIEKKWQDHWLAAKTFAWDASVARADSYVIDTPPPTVSGTLHMGHVYSYTQADFIARFQRMNGKNVFYPMGFDDNGLPTERLVEKTKKIRAVDMSREDFIAECLGVSEEARAEFRALFQSIALSVDWDQEYHTISDDVRRLSQLSFLDLVEKGHAYRALKPFYWDPVDQTAIAQAEIVDKEMPSHQNIILFELVSHSPLEGESKSASDSVGGTIAQKSPHQNPKVGFGSPSGGEQPFATASSISPQISTNDAAAPPEADGVGWCEGQKLPVMTTRPELLPACVALMYHPDDDAKYKGKTARTPLFNIEVPMIADEKVDKEKGTGLVMCCTFGDDTDKEWWEKHKLATRVILNKYGKLDLSSLTDSTLDSRLSTLLQGKKVSNPDPKNLGARETIIALLKDAGLLTEQKAITHTVKCAERSGAPLEILPSEQWFVRVMDKKDALKEKAQACNWNPEWMRVRIEQWIDGLSQDWCISRQRYFGVPFPVWYVQSLVTSHQSPEMIFATPDMLPVNPLTTPPPGFTTVRTVDAADGSSIPSAWIVRDAEGKEYHAWPDTDVMDTWATSSISPQISAGAIHSRHCEEALADAAVQTGLPRTHGARNDEENARFNALFPADLRPQAHEIIRTWAFYTIVKAHLHNDDIPWKNLMISGWCLAEDKSKMSKSKGNVVTPVALIEEKGTDAVRYWAATSRLGQDTAFSPDLLKIGKKLVGKLWNATAFAAIHLSKLDGTATTAATDSAITEMLDQWILSRLGQTARAATEAFEGYEYAVALDATNQFFWADFCDNYLELIKKRVYNEDGSFTPAQQQSAVRALYYCLQGILKLYAPVVPHVTEELYAHIFPDAYEKHGSLHARYQWVKAEDYQINLVAIESGRLATEVLDQIRKAKSVANLSIKFPIETLAFFIEPSGIQDTDWLKDVMGAGNVRNTTLSPIRSDRMKQINDSKMWIQITFAEEADAA